MDFTLAGCKSPPSSFVSVSFLPQDAPDLEIVHVERALNGAPSTLGNPFLRATAVTPPALEPDTRHALFTLPQFEFSSILTDNLL